MKKYNNAASVATLLMCAGGGVLASSPSLAEFSEFDANLSGYVRTTVGISLEDHEETRRDDEWDVTMARATLHLDLDVFTGPLTWKAVGRFDKEMQTSYLDDLEDLSIAQSAGLCGNTCTDDYMDQYDTDDISEFLREFYVDFRLFDSLDVRFGKQQLVWGESDFFQAMDLVHGYDYRWRLFFENNEDWRKPLVLANFNMPFYEQGGNLNFFIRPGWDRDEAMGSNYNIEGGRWIPHPYRGVDFTAFTKAYQTGHKNGDWDDPTYGIRWTGNLDSIGYSVAYLKTFNPAPIINPTSSTAVTGLFGVTSSTPWAEEPDNQVLGDWIYPEIDVYGVTVNGYSSALNSTLSAEIAYIPNKPFNYGQLDSSLPGWQGIKEKDVVSMMYRIDKELRLMDVLGTNRPSLSSIQLFDTWITGHRDADEIVEFASFASKKKEHTVFLTFFTLMNFKRDTINPSFVIGTDLSNGGGFAIPAVEFVFGDNWRLKVEADLWWNDGDKKHVSETAPNGAHLNPLGTNEHSAAFFDWFSDDNQLVFKLTRQF